MHVSKINLEILKIIYETTPMVGDKPMIFTKELEVLNNHLCK